MAPETTRMLPNAIPVRAITYGMVMVPAPTVQAIKFMTDELIEPAFMDVQASASYIH